MTRQRTWWKWNETNMKGLLSSAWYLFLNAMFAIHFTGPYSFYRSSEDVCCVCTLGWGSRLCSFRVTPTLGDNYTAYCLSQGGWERLRLPFSGKGNMNNIWIWGIKVVKGGLYGIMMNYHNMLYHGYRYYFKRLNFMVVILMVVNCVL